MSLEKKDLRVKMPPHLLDALKIFADVSDLDYGEYAELILTKHLETEITKSLLAAKRLERAGIVGSSGE